MSEPRTAMAGREPSQITVNGMPLVVTDLAAS